MNILILDFGLSKTHVLFNLRYFKALSSFGNLYIINSGNYYDEMKQYKNVTLLETRIVQRRDFIENKLKIRNSIFNRILIFFAMLENKKALKKIDKNVKFDYTLITGYEIITFCLYRYMFNLKNTVIFQHQQINELESSIKKFFFNSYANLCVHIVLSESFKTFLKEKNVNRVEVVHYLNDLSLVRKHDRHQISSNANIIFISISSTNDENKVKTIIDIEKQSKIFEKKQITYYIRSKKYVYNDNYLIVNNDFLSPDDYLNKIFNATANISLLPDDYGYRSSGWIQDALSCGIVNIAPPIPLVKEYEKAFPSLFYIYNNIEELLQIMNNITNISFHIIKEEIENSRQINSLESVLSDFRRIFSFKVR